MTRTLKLLVPIGLALVAVVALLAAGSGGVAQRTAVAEVPNLYAMPALHRGGEACEGPLVSHGPARQVAIWGGSGTPSGQVTVTVQDAATHNVLASGTLQTSAVRGRWVARLDQQVPGGRPLLVCVTDDAGTFALGGAVLSAPGLAATGLPTGQKFSLALLSDGDRSLFGSLSTAFSRASLWRPSWVGPWTFWLLVIALLATFGLAVVAVVRATDDDEPPPPSATPERPPDVPSEPRQDRPQPVS